MHTAGFNNIKFTDWTSRVSPTYAKWQQINENAYQTLKNNNRINQTQLKTMYQITSNIWDITSRFVTVKLWPIKTKDTIKVYFIGSVSPNWLESCSIYQE